MVPEEINARRLLTGERRANPRDTATSGILFLGSPAFFYCKITGAYSEGKDVSAVGVLYGLQILNELFGLSAEHLLGGR